MSIIIMKWESKSNNYNNLAHILKKSKTLFLKTLIYCNKIKTLNKTTQESSVLPLTQYVALDYIWVNISTGQTPKKHTSYMHMFLLCLILKGVYKNSWFVKLKKKKTQNNNNNKTCLLFCLYRTKTRNGNNNMLQCWFFVYMKKTKPHTKQLSF